ncbi:THO complex subunit 1 [Tolypocladium paradoxum]|uniref:THO complex subunit 1 n=1 Tax=Tolypocladium paradoxum TaxID=94208 RepID=A0A2S4L3X5_9HYPO|nr:THO complex subunit 1 [Tolypocladium paradoxum]
MPALDVENPGVPAVASVEKLLEDLLDEASLAKQTSTVEPALNASDFKDLSNRISASLSSDAVSREDRVTTPQEAAKSRQFAIIETAARDLFDKLIAATPIDSPEFVKMWNLLDILSILSDNGQCDPALLFWLVEELLDSQTIAGCRKLFDYLESRRERITAKHFKQKNLVILRSCNELLRRLSRAEDTAFCGRVFIFLFQSFPLGDRSSVNLRGEYHVENITSFETEAVEEESKMDVDGQAPTPKESTDPKAVAKGVSFDSKDSQKSIDPDSLYPLFWSLQESFSQPLKLFDAAHFNNFKRSLDATMKAFQAIHQAEGSQSSKSIENLRRNLKRKTDEEEGIDDVPETFNPKYLTSKDLFELEVEPRILKPSTRWSLTSAQISDLSFRRHVLVQALVITDFILSMSTGAKEKLANISASNKSVVYNDQLNAENVSLVPHPRGTTLVNTEQTKWASEMKTTISDYLKRGLDGPYFYRMVETVLARDKNWVFWKMASCPPIQREPVSNEAFNESKSTAQRMATSKRLRPTPMGAVSMDFLRDDIHKLAMDNLKSPERYQLPELDDFKSKIADDDFEIAMPTNEQTKAAAIAGKASKSWRALRLGGRFKLAAFDKIDDPKNIDPIFQDLDDEDDDGSEDEDAAGEEDMPENHDPIIITGPKGVGKSALVEKLLEQHKGVLASVVRHTVREPRDGEVKGKTFHFVTAQEFNQLRDGDRLIEYGTRDGIEYGTSVKAIEAILETGRVPVIELDLESAQFAKDMDAAARYILINPPSPSSLQDRLSKSGHDEAAIQAILAKLRDETDEIKVAELFDKTVTNDDLEQAVEALSAYIFEKEGEDERRQQAEDDVAPAEAEAKEEPHRNDGDASMADAQTDKATEENNDDDARRDRTEERCIEVKM